MLYDSSSAKQQHLGLRLNLSPRSSCCRSGVKMIQQDQYSKGIDVRTPLTARPTNEREVGSGHRDVR